MPEGPAIQEVVESEIRKFQGYLLFADIQGLKKGSYADVARTILRRVKHCFIGLAVFLLLAWQMGFAMTPDEAWPEQLGRTFSHAFWLVVLLYLVYKWGRVSGSMHTVLALLGNGAEEKDHGSAEDRGAALPRGGDGTPPSSS